MKTIANILINLLRISFLLLLLPACSKSQEPSPDVLKSTNEMPLDTPTKTMSILFESLTPTPVSSSQSSLLMLGKDYWINAMEGPSGRYAILEAGSISTPGVLDYIYIAGTKVKLLGINGNYCMIEGQPYQEDIIAQVWVRCSRLIDYEPTMPPDELINKSP